MIVLRFFPSLIESDITHTGKQSSSVFSVQDVCINSLSINTGHTHKRTQFSLHECMDQQNNDNFNNLVLQFNVCISEAVICETDCLTVQWTKLDYYTVKQSVRVHLCCNVV